MWLSEGGNGLSTCCEVVAIGCAEPKLVSQQAHVTCCHVNGNSELTHIDTQKALRTFRVVHAVANTSRKLLI